MNPFTVLELPDGASKRDVKQAYRRLAGKYHPDKNPNPGATERFKLVKEAYEFLTTGRSASKIFGQSQVNPVKPPHYQPPMYRPPVEPEGFAPPIEVKLSFADVFSAGRQRVPWTNYYFNLPAYVRDGQLYRAKAWDDSMDFRYYNLKFKLFDPTDFYKIEKGKVVCNVDVTIGQVLAGADIFIKNLNPDLPDVSIGREVTDKAVTLLCANHKRIMSDADRLAQVDEAGLYGPRKRDPIWVRVNLVYKSLEGEDYHTLLELKKTIDGILSNYEHIR